MAETRTARMRLVHWSEGTDSPQRVDFNETFLSIENLAAIDQQGVEQDRPLPNKRGMYYFATDKGILYRSDGLAWAVVGSSTLSQLVRSARSDAVAMTIQAIAGQTADLLRATSTSGATYVRVRPNGDVLAGPVRISQAARTTTTADTAPTDSAVTIDSASASMWNHTAKNTTGNTAGFYRAVRGTSTVFSVAPDGSVSTPAVTLTSAPSSDNHAVRRTDLTSAIASNVYDINGSNISGVLGVAKGGTGGTTQATARSGIGAAASATTITAGDGLSGGGALSASRTLSITFANGTAWGADQGSSTLVARYDHEHHLDQSKIIGVLPVSKGGTGGTTAASARTGIGAAASATTFTAGTGLSGGGTLGASRTFSVDYAGDGTANSAARSDHTHDINSSSVTGTLSIAGGGTGRSNASPGAYPRWNTAGDAFEGVTPANLRTDIGAATSGHGHALTDANITGTLPVSQGGTGATSVAAARTALAVPSTSVSVNAGAGLSGGGTLASSRTLQVVFEGSGSKTTAARSDHGHALTDTNLTGTLPINQGGTNATTAAAARSSLAAAYSATQIIAGTGLSGGGTLAANRTLNVNFPSASFTLDGSSTGSSDIAARYNHYHNLTGTYIEGNLPWEKNSLPITLSTEDLDTITSTAVYHQGSNANATSARNYPSSVAGRLEVTTVGLMTYQTYTDYTHSGSVWRRSKYGSNAWYAWKKLAEVGSDIDPLATRVGELEPVVATLALPSTSKWTGHGYQPQIIREGKRRTLRGRVSPTGADFAQKGGANYLFNLPAIDRPSAAIGGIGQITGFASPGFARVEIGNSTVPAGDVLAGTSKTTDWIGLDGITWYVD